MKKTVPHLSLALSLMVLTFFIIDRYNDVMAFMTSELSKWIIAGLALTSAISSICLIAENIKAKARAAALEERRMQKKLLERRRAEAARRTAEAYIPSRDDSDKNKKTERK